MNDIGTDANMSEKLVVRPDSVIHDIIEGEAVVMNLETGMYYSFNSPATQIWARISTGSPDRREVLDFAGAQNHTFLDFLLEQGLVMTEEFVNGAVENQMRIEPVMELAKWNQKS